jgi:hypothetical protein
MTWGTVIDARRALTSFFLTMLVLVIGLFICISLLVKGNILTANYSGPISPPITTVAPMQ